MNKVSHEGGQLEGGVSLWGKHEKALPSHGHAHRNNFCEGKIHEDT